MTGISSFDIENEEKNKITVNSSEFLELKLESVLNFAELKNVIIKYKNEVASTKNFIKKWFGCLNEKEKNFDSRINEIKIIILVIKKEVSMNTEEFDI